MANTSIPQGLGAAAGILGQYQSSIQLQNAIKNANAASTATTPILANRSPGLWSGQQPVNTDAYQGGYI
jgi:hypothetical protein